MTTSGHRLRPFRAGDIHLRVEWLNDPRVRDFMPIAGQVDQATTRQWFERVQADPSRVDFALEYDACVVAMGGLTAIDRAVGRAELYAFVGPGAQGRGHGTALVRALCDAGFGAQKLNRIFLWTYATNAAALRLYERVGFRLEGILREHARTRDGLTDRYIMGMLRAEWQAQLWDRPNGGTGE